MNFLQTLPLVLTFFLLGFGLYMLLKNIKSMLNVIFVFICIALSAWLIGTYKMMTVTLVSDFIFWNRFIYIGLVFIPILFYNLVYIFVNGKSKLHKVFIAIGYLLAVGFLLFSRTGHFLGEVFEYPWGGQMQANIYHNAFLVYAIVLLLFLFFNLLRFYIHTNSALAKAQSRVIFLALFILLLAGCWLFLPTYGFAIYPLSYLLGVLFVGVLGYGLIKHRFTSFSMVIKRGLVFGLAIIITMFITLPLYNTMLANFPFIYGLEGILVLISLLMFLPIRNLLLYFANKYFFADIYNYQKVMRELSHRLTSIIDLDEVVDSIINTINKSFKLNKSGLILYHQNEHFIKCQVVKTKGYMVTDLNAFANSNFLIRFLELNKSIILQDEIPLLLNATVDEGLRKGLKIIQEKMRQYGIALCIPMLKENRLVGIIILSNKMSGEAYSNEDLELIDTLSNQASVAIDNALLYQKVKDFNIQLQEKVREATIDLKRINRKLKYSNANLEQLDKAKSEFLSIASHQLRTPLSGIKGYLSMLLEGDFGEMPKSVHDVVKELFQNSDRMARLINTFLNISRIEANRLVISRESTDIKDLAQHIVKGMEPDANKKSIDLQLDLPVKSVYAMVDSDKLKDALINIVDNAIKYTQKGFVKVSVKEDIKDIMVEVTDSGVGIDPADLANLFQKFTRGSEIAKVDTSGSGLGLFIVKKIIEAHGGEVYVKSPGKGQGSTFGFIIPKEVQENN